VAPFEKKTGNYSLELKVVEPVATEPGKRADQLFYPYSEEGVPGGVVGVIKNGELVFSRAYGMANLTHGIPYEVKLEDLRSSSMLERRAQLENLNRELSILIGVYELGHPQTKDEAIDAVLSYEFAESIG